MPFIHIKSLPFQQPVNVGTVVEGLTRDFAKATGIGLEHVTATWAFLDRGHYAVGGKAAFHQPLDSHPIVVDLLVPDDHPADAVGAMLAAVATSISTRVGIPLDNIFINCRQAHAGMVFDAGAVVHW